LRPNYPFVALVGQDALRDALLWIAVDPSIGGLLVTGTRGTAKSTAARALADVLPPITVVQNDAFNREPTGAEESTLRATPFVELPVGATEDRVVGTLDVRALLADAERRFEPGLLARANRGVLYVDEVNLLPDHLVDVLLDASATGTNIVERDGVSFAHDARIVLVGTMNPEEGELRPQLLDRFGLCVAIASDDDVAHRVAILERRLAYERDADAFVEAHATETHALRERVAAARARVPDVSYDARVLKLAAELAIAARAEGMRADLTIVRAARAIAALDGRSTVDEADVIRAATAALAHRRREAPPPPRPPMPPQPPRNGSPRDEHSPSDHPADARPAAAPEPPRTFDVGAPIALAYAADMRRPATTPTGRPRIVRATTRAVAFLATIRVAAEEGARIAARHIRFVERRGRERQLVVFLVDASGSMAAAARMRAAKGAVCALLEDAYRRRDAVALIAFRGTQARTLVPPTRSAALAYRRLRSMQTGGRTPLADGLRVARNMMVAAAQRDPGARAHLVLISDARANAPEHEAFGAALQEAALLRARAVRVLCVDTETGRIRLGQAARLAEALGATYQHLDDCSERTLGATVREWMATA